MDDVDALALVVRGRCRHDQAPQLALGDALMRGGVVVVHHGSLLSGPGRVGRW
ncbi:MAG: hypothetical protein ABIR34_13335 [Marmoricola sp.]